MSNYNYDLLSGLLVTDLACGHAGVGVAVALTVVAVAEVLAE